jgi:hypothetical protein
MLINNLIIMLINNFYDTKVNIINFDVVK